MSDSAVPLSGPRRDHGVSTNPGQIALTRTPWGAKSSAELRVIPSSADLVAAYPENPRTLTSAAHATFTTAPNHMGESSSALMSPTKKTKESGSSGAKLR
ncbi:MAG TPA: hypothetical protein VFK05_07045 [Polyangiaceae bacterium]|nr:hypothetical protein [Polyangiaceae bacterium]